MLKMAKRGRNAPGCLLRDATATDFESETFDLAMIIFALHETGWKNAHAILNEVQRILKPGGQMNCFVLMGSINMNWRVL